MSDVHSLRCLAVCYTNTNRYSHAVFHEFTACFALLPLVTVIESAALNSAQVEPDGGGLSGLRANKRVIVLHGGLGSDMALMRLGEIDQFPRWGFSMFEGDAAVHVAKVRVGRSRAGVREWECESGCARPVQTSVSASASAKCRGQMEGGGGEGLVTLKCGNAV